MILLLAAALMYAALAALERAGEPLSVGGREQGAAAAPVSSPSFPV